MSVAGLEARDFDYDLPDDLIAQIPVEPRDHSRLMVIVRSDDSIRHHRFHELPQLLRPGDVLVFNDSRVMSARLYGRSSPSGSKMELLLLESKGKGIWKTLVKPGRRMREGALFEIYGGGHRVNGEVITVNGDGSRIVFLSDESCLDEIGVVPLPPYIRQPLDNPERYQTVYSRIQGSVAAPTAGLHFTTELLKRVRRSGIELAFVTLHVGWDSFRPIATGDVYSHQMHSEYWELNQDAANTINCAKIEGRRVISVGTTAVRLLEQAASLNVEKAENSLSAGSGWTNLFIYPDYEFKIVDALITNFHLPRSTLLMLTSALAGRNIVLRAYKNAAAHRYRFYSLGDAMLIV